MSVTRDDLHPPPPSLSRPTSVHPLGPIQPQKNMPFYFLRSNQTLSATAALPYKGDETQGAAYARQYVQSCQEMRNKQHIFVDFDKQLVHHIENRNRGQVFTHSFVEYVVLEVEFQNVIAARRRRRRRRRGREAVPTRNDDYGMTLLEQSMICFARWKCWFLYGATPKYHGEVYATLINDCLLKKKKKVFRRCSAPTGSNYFPPSNDSRRRRRAQRDRSHSF